MTPLERLKAITRPMDQQELAMFLMMRYGAVSRENVSANESALSQEDLAQLEQERAS